MKQRKIRRLRLRQQPKQYQQIRFRILQNSSFSSSSFAFIIPIISIFMTTSSILILVQILILPPNVISALSIPRTKNLRVPIIIQYGSRRGSYLYGSRFDNDNGGGRINKVDDNRNSINNSNDHLDPLILSILTAATSDNNDGASIGRIGGGMMEASRGLTVWRNILRRGRLPIPSDFDIRQNDIDSYSNSGNGGGGGGDDCCCWPSQPLFNSMIQSMTNIRIGGFVRNHPEVINSLLLHVLRMNIDFRDIYQSHLHQEEIEDDDDTMIMKYDDDDDVLLKQQQQKHKQQHEQESEQNKASLCILQQKIAKDITEKYIVKKWTNLVNGMNSLDKVIDITTVQGGNKNNGGSSSSGSSLFTLFNDDDNIDSIDMTNTNTDPSSSHGFNDGIWHHTGWKELPDLQQHVSTLPKLKELMERIGGRPTVSSSSSSSKNERFARRIKDKEGVNAACRDSMSINMPPDDPSMYGLARTGRLSLMLPSEAVMLLGDDNDEDEYNVNTNKKNKETSTIINRHRKYRRLLFLSNLVTSNLPGYDTAPPYVNSPSKIHSDPSKRYPFERFPRSEGDGPIIICLDTSWSMSTYDRERDSKALVLAMVASAYKKGRECLVVSFSNERGVMESGLILDNDGNKDNHKNGAGGDGAGLVTLLDFLAGSFGGGTDVTGALRHVMNTMCNINDSADKSGISSSSSSSPTSSSSSSSSSRISLSAADIVLVTDGELPNPPLSKRMMYDLDEWKRLSGTELHGLLIGECSSVSGGNSNDDGGMKERMEKNHKALSTICDEIHDFMIVAPDDRYNFSSEMLSTEQQHSSSLTKLYALSMDKSVAVRSCPLLIGRRSLFTSTTRRRGVWFGSRRSREFTNGMFATTSAVAVTAGKNPTMLHARGKKKKTAKGKNGSRFDDDVDDNYYEDDSNWGGGEQQDFDGSGDRGEKFNVREADIDDNTTKKDDSFPLLTTILSPISDADADDLNRNTNNIMLDDFDGRVDAALEILRSAVDSHHWDSSELNHEMGGNDSDNNNSNNAENKDDAGNDSHQNKEHSHHNVHLLRKELGSAVDAIGWGLVERETEARLVVLGMISEEHVLLLGPPGTGKSILGSRLSSICGGNFFQRLLTRFTTPEEIFGPLSLRGLENDEYRRVTDGFLPTASVAFLDEIFKANSAILNSLLTILNERRFDNGGGGKGVRGEVCPIRCVVGASNELPESDELDALYDRFLLRREVLPVSDDGIIRMLNMPLLESSPRNDLITNCDGDGRENFEEKEKYHNDILFSDGLDSTVKKLSIAADAVEMTKGISILMKDLRRFMSEELNVYVSDRRLVKAARLLKISAASHGRTKVDPLDCLLLQHIAWRLPHQQASVKEWLWENITPGITMDDSIPSAVTMRFRLVLDSIRQEAYIALRRSGGDITGDSGAQVQDLNIIKSLAKEASHISNAVYRRMSALSRHIYLIQQSTDHLWLHPDEAKAAQQELLPIAEEFKNELDCILVDARSLELALTDDQASISNDLRLVVIERLWNNKKQVVNFSNKELGISMKEAKSKYDVVTFRQWKKAHRKIVNG